MAQKEFITTGERVRGYLGVAFLLSILVNAIFAPFYPNVDKHHTDDQVEKVSVSKKAIVKPPKTPSPTPTPKPTPTPPPQQTPPPQPKQAVQPKLKVNVPKTTNNSSTSSTESQYNVTKGSESGVPAGTGATTAPGTPAPTPKPACANPFQDATVTNPVSLEYPDSARDLDLGPVTVLVEVTVAPSGNLVAAVVYKSSNNMAIDQAALREARQSSYSPKLVNCVPTQGDYLFRAEFNPD